MKEQVPKPNLKCEACGRNPATDRHHFIHRWELYDYEIDDEKYVVYLCKDCHINKYHSKIGCGLYIFYGMVEMLTERCEKDQRWIRRIEAYKFKNT